MKLLDILKFSEEYLQKYSFSKPKVESQKLIAGVLNTDRITLFMDYDRELTEDEKKIIKTYLKEMAETKLTFDELNKSKGKDALDLKDYRKENLDILNKSIGYLEGYGVPNAKIDAEYILAHVLNTTRNMLTLNLSKKISDDKKDKIRKLLMQRGKERYPLQYLLGEWEFYGYPFKVDERVLIPRPDTEILVENCKHLIYSKKNIKICDVGTGSGAIAITLGKEMPESQVLGIDISDDALNVANINKELNEATNVKFLKSDVFEKLREEKYKNVKFDIIVSNPPYIPLQEYQTLMPEVLNYEPKNALTDNKDGYYFYDKISKEAKDFLTLNGYLAFEVGYNQAEKVKELMEQNDFINISIIKDYSGIERVVIGQKKEGE